MTAILEFHQLKADAARWLADNLNCSDQSDVRTRPRTQFKSVKRIDDAFRPAMRKREVHSEPASHALMAEILVALSTIFAALASKNGLAHEWH
jgi:hypothetical protein